VRRPAETWLFRGAVALLVVHLVDHGFLEPRPGTSAGDHLTTVLIPSAVAIGAAVVHPRLPPGLRASLVFVFGAFAAADGVLHAMLGLHGADFSGVVLLLPAAALFLASAVLALLDRGRPRSWPRRIGRWVLTAVVGILLLLFVGLPIVIGVAQTQKPAEPIDDSALELPHQTVTFPAADGTKLRGWYIPSKNRAAVIVVHGGGGDRTGSLRHARLLSSLGYGVLLYDSRGRGESDGDPNAQGWTWQDDVPGAIAFVRRRSDVDPERIAALGLSTGADVLIEAAAKHRELKAVIADGSTVRSLADVRRSKASDLIMALPYWTVAYGTIEILDQSVPGPPLAKLAGEVPPTPLLIISSDELGEHRWGRIYADAYGQRAKLWLTDTAHTKALQEHPGEYRARVQAFLARALG
jgi:fermentation-respiration switch protein FrsA (DUF1100 family)